MSTLKAQWKPNFEPYEGPESTEEFNRAFSNHGGHAEFTCNCGRVWFDGGEAVEVDYPIEQIMGFVIGCPCNLLRRYEDWVWTNRERILEYLRTRNAKELKEATSLQDQCKRAEANNPLANDLER